MSYFLGIDGTTALLFLTVVWLVATDEAQRKQGYMRYLIGFLFVLHVVALILRTLPSP